MLIAWSKVFIRHSAFSRQHLLLQISSCPADAIDRLDLNPLAAGTDDGLDELAVGVFVAAIHELRERLDAIRALIVHTREIKRAKRVVSRTNDKQPGKPPVALIEQVVETGSLEGGQIFAGASTELDAAGTQLVSLCLGR